LSKVFIADLRRRGLRVPWLWCRFRRSSVATTLVISSWAFTRSSRRPARWAG